MHAQALSIPADSGALLTPPKDGMDYAKGMPGVCPLSLSVLSDKERELHIRSCAWLMEDAMRRYYDTSYIGYRGEADRWRLLMEEAIKGRSPAQVAKMERERGLA
jgi:hypothetical protein